jgi:phosphatidylglycerophosphatase A
VIVWIAQGFGIGRVPVAPGTFGSVLGIGWLFLLLSSGRLWVLLVGSLVGLAASVWLCGVAERALGQKDPGSVVLDEVAAIPICFFGWVGMYWWRTGTLAAPDFFFSRNRWLLTLGVFASFRFFDIAKPWPVRQSQALPGGWGITVDDLLAAVYVNLLILLAYVGNSLASHA